MASGDRMCPNCGQWQAWCRCGTAANRQTNSPWVPLSIGPAMYSLSYQPALTVDELAEIRSLLEVVRRKGAEDPDWFSRTFGTPERFDLETKSSMELDSPTYEDSAVTELKARDWERINDPRKAQA